MCNLNQMKKLLVLLFCFLPFKDHAQQPQIIKINQLKAIIGQPDDRILVLNFWATWCGPCVSELPLFEKLNAENRPDVRVALVSLDLDLDPDPKKVYKFVSRKKLRSEVFVLDEKDPNAWIDQIDGEWSGALPATIVINKKTGKRKFVGTALKPGEIERLIKEVQELN